MHKPLLALAAALLSTPAMADTLVHNANGIQVGPDARLQRFAALLIGDDGKVVRTFAPGEALPARVGRRVDAGGRTLLPGLIDAHGHLIDAPGGDMGLGLLVLRLDLGGVGSVAEMQERLRRYHLDNRDGGWILGRGWNQELWADKRFPTAADLDSVVADRPVVLTRIDGHAAVVNSAALKAAGITAATPDPEGGKIERNSSGEPTGLLVDTAAEMVARLAPAPTAEAMDRGLDKAQEILLRSGVTTMMDMGTSTGSWAALRRAGASSRLKIRVIGYSDGFGPLPADIGGKPTGWLHGDRLRMAGIKLYADGALGSRGAWLKAPYSDAPGSSGAPVTSPAKLLEQGRAAARAGFQLAIHAIGDRANAEAISVFEQLGRGHSGDRRWRIEHVQVIDPADLARLAPAGIIASMQPTHQTSDRTMAERRLDPPRLPGAYAWRSVLASGARLAFGSDFPVESPNPFPGLGAAISRQDASGQPPGGWYPAQRLSSGQALHAFTRGAAHAGFAEDKIGALEGGKWADFIIVDRDVSLVDPQEVYGTQVLETWVAGEKMWSRPASAAGERG